MPQNPNDPRPAVSRALDQVEDLIKGITPEQAQLPTPCSDFDVEQLVGHLLAVVRRIGVVLSGQPFHTVPSHRESSDWTGDWVRLRAETDAVLADDACLTRETVVPWGTVPGAAALGMYIGELTVHSWDLAQALGRTDALDPALAELALPAYHCALPAEPRGGERIPFGPVVEVGADAGPYERLVAWTGRTPTPA